MSLLRDAARRLPPPVREQLRTSYDLACVLASMPRILTKQGGVERPQTAGHRPAAGRRPDSWVDLEGCGTLRPYVKTFNFDGAYISDYHSKIAHAPGRREASYCVDLGIGGYLAHAEALKLYEMGFFSDGDVIELGTYRGLSTSIIARALHDRQGGVLYTCDISRRFSTSARAALRWLPGRDRVKFHVGDAPRFLDSMIAAGRRFGFIFVDHWHGYDATHAVGIRLHSLLAPGGFVMFHDYNDASARDATHPDKVFQAVRDTVGRDPSFEFSCVTASSACFRYQPAVASERTKTASHNELSLR